MSDEDALDRDEKTGRFVPGRAKTGGRKKGSTSLKTQILKAMDNVHPRGRQGYLDRLAREEPKTFAQLVQKVLPTEIAAELTKVEERVVEVRDYATPTANKDADHAPSEEGGSVPEAPSAEDGDWIDVEPIVH